jgi:L-fucose mutarotase
MLLGIDPLLTGRMLWALDRMGHADAVAIVDAHFPAPVGDQTQLEVPGIPAPALVRAVCTVLPIDEADGAELLAAPDGLLPVQSELLAAAGSSPAVATISQRADFYAHARAAVLVLRTGETRAYGNLILRKGLVDPPAG